MGKYFSKNRGSADITTNKTTTKTQEVEVSSEAATEGTPMAGEGSQAPQATSTPTSSDITVKTSTEDDKKVSEEKLPTQSLEEQEPSTSDIATKEEEGPSKEEHLEEPVKEEDVVLKVNATLPSTAVGDQPTVEARHDVVSQEEVPEAKSEDTKVEHPDESKVEHREEPKVEHEEPKVEHREEPRVEHQEEPRVEHQEEPRVEHQEEPRVEHQEELRVENQEPKVENQEPKVEHQEGPKVEHQEGPKVEHQEGPKVEHQEEPKVEQHEEPTTQNLDSPTPQHQDETQTHQKDEISHEVATSEHQE